MKFQAGAIALVSTLLACNAASADSSVLYGNTLQVTFADGVVAKAHFNADGTYSETRGASTVKGTWTAADGKMCLTQVEPAGGPVNFCTPEITHKVGESWTATGPGGKPVSLTLVAGR
jgi:hypothetical protein